MLPHSQNGKRPDWASIDEKVEAKFDYLFDVGYVCFCGIFTVCQSPVNERCRTEPGPTPGSYI
jgi:hypothetical protein